MKILIGVDASPHSDAAIEFVAGTTWPEGTSAVVVSAVNVVVPVASEIYSPASANLGPLLEESRNLAKAVTDHGVERLRGAGITAESRIGEGDPRVVLVDVAKHEGSDLIVVGSHGRTGLAKLLMGSVAAHVVSHAPCNVLVIKTPKP